MTTHGQAPPGSEPEPSPAADPDWSGADDPILGPAGDGDAAAAPDGGPVVPGAEPAEDARGAVADGVDEDGGAPIPLPDLADALLVGYLDAALATLRASSPTELPGQLRQYQAWTPRRLKHPRVVSVVRRTLDLDHKFRAAVDERVLQEEDVLARLIRAGRHAEALASGEPPEAVARVGVALGQDGVAAVRAAEDALARSRAPPRLGGAAGRQAGAAPG